MIIHHSKKSSQCANAFNLFLGKGIYTTNGIWGSAQKNYQNSLLSGDKCQHNLVFNLLKGIKLSIRESSIPK